MHCVHEKTLSLSKRALDGHSHSAPSQWMRKRSGMRKIRSAPVPKRIVQPSLFVMIKCGGHHSLAESSKLTCHERALSRRTSGRWFCHTSGVVTGRKLGCTKKNICAILLEAQRFLRV